VYTAVIQAVTPQTPNGCHHLRECSPGRLSTE
jgi:hypothetical protein